MPIVDTSDGRLFSLDMETDLYFQTVRQHVLTDEGTLRRLDWGNLFPLVDHGVRRGGYPLGVRGGAGSGLSAWTLQCHLLLGA